MRTLHRYLTREVLASLLMTVAVFTFVILIVNVLKEVLGLVVNGQASLASVGLAIAFLVPWVLVFALPMGMLTATLLVFGRFSADQELTAVRAGGVSLVALITPVLLLSVALSGVSALINMEVGPRCRVAYKRLIVNMGLSAAAGLLPENTFIKDFAGHIVYIGNVKENDLKDVLIYHLEGGNVDYYIRADEGRITVDVPGRKLLVQLSDAFRVGLVDGKRTPMYLGAAEFSKDLTREEEVELSDMTFPQLWRELRAMEERLNHPAALRSVSRDKLAEAMRALHHQREDLALPIKVQIHRQLSFSFACIGFTLIGIPLGIRAHRRETSFNIAIALLLVMVYYSFFIVAQSLDTRPEWAPHLILWLPNFVFQAIGAVLLWRANRGI